MGMPDRHAGQHALPGIGRALTARCTRCREAKPLSKFGRDPNKRNGRTSRCNSCKSVAVERWKVKNRDKYRQMTKAWREKNREYIGAKSRQRLYGLSDEAFRALAEQQGGRCAICGDETVKFHVDHCHATRKVRGLLCGGCNAGLGLFKDDERRLAAAIEYLKNTKADGV